MDEILEMLADEYQFKLRYVKEYWNIIQDIPIVADSPIEKQQECLETIIFDRLSILFQTENATKDTKKQF